MALRPSATIRAADRKISAVAEPVFRLVVIEGPDGGGAGKRTTFTLEGSQAPRVLMGTSPACHLRLTDARVSRRHLSLELSGGRLRVMDLDSTNGTRVSGVAIGEVYLHGGETIQLGATTLAVEKSPDDTAEAFVSDEIAFGRFIGVSVAMRRLYPLCRRLAETTVPVLIEGEPGTGKELLAEALHEQGARASSGGACVVIEGSSLSVDAIEPAIEEAKGGTLVIDDVAELSLAAQSRIVRELERKPPPDVRVIAVTRRDLDREVADGRFRDDLFFVLAIGRIELPPLRRRHKDVNVLARHFWVTLGGLPEDFPEAMMTSRFAPYGWPGNVRELQQTVARLFATGDVATPEAGPLARVRSDGDDFIDRVVAQKLGLARAREMVVNEFERRYVEDAFDSAGGNVTKAASASGIALRYFRALRARQRDAK